MSDADTPPTVTGLRRWVTYRRFSGGGYQRNGETEIAVVEVVAEIDDADKWPVVIRTALPSEAVDTCRAHNAALALIGPQTVTLATKPTDPPATPQEPARV